MLFVSGKFAIRKSLNFMKRLIFFQDPYSSGGGVVMVNSSSKSLQSALQVDDSVSYQKIFLLYSME